MCPPYTTGVQYFPCVFQSKVCLLQIVPRRIMLSIHSAKFCLLVRVFNPCVFNVIAVKIDLPFYYLFSVCLKCYFFLLFLNSSITAFFYIK